MADLVITAANVVPVSGYTYEASYLAGVSLVRGDTAYLDSSTNTMKKADCNDTAATAAIAGVVLNDAGANQPVTVLTSGDLGMGAILTQGEIYVLSANPGKIAPEGDLSSGHRVVLVGVATSTSNLRVRMWNSGAQL